MYIPHTLHYPYHTQIHISHYSHPHAMHAHCTHHTTHITYGHIKHIKMYNTCTTYIPPTCEQLPWPFPACPCIGVHQGFQSFLQNELQTLRLATPCTDTISVLNFCTLELDYGTLTAPCPTRTVGQTLSSALLVRLCLLVEIFSM